MDTILGQGTFTVGATVVPVVVKVPQGADWIKVFNYTQSKAAGQASTPFAGLEFFWQFGMPAGSAQVKYYGAATNPLYGDVILNGGFTVYDPSSQISGAKPTLSTPVAVTAVSNATKPVVSTGDTTGVVAGSIIRIYNTSAVNFLGGIDWYVDSVSANTSITLLTTVSGASGNALKTAPGNLAGAGFYQIVNYPYTWYPHDRFITNIDITANRVYTSVPHGYLVGQVVQFAIPAICKTIQLNPTPENNYLNATVTSVSTDGLSFVVDTDMTAFTTFVSPTIALQPSNWPQVIPVGQNTPYSLAQNVNILSGATVNQSYYGMILGTGSTGAAITGATISGPAGFAASDVMYWMAGKSSYVNATFL